MLAVVVADVEGEGEYQFERRQFGTTPDHLRLLSEWFVEQEVEEVVMESTAQYWKPVWGALERHWKPTCQKREGAGPARHSTGGDPRDYRGSGPPLIADLLDCGASCDYQSFCPGRSGSHDAVVVGIGACSGNIGKI
jgi:hypothetical protein